MPHLDGSRDRAWMRQALSAAFERGDLRADDAAGGNQVGANIDIATLAARAVDTTIEFLARNALLEP